MKTTKAKQPPRLDFETLIALIQHAPELASFDLSWGDQDWTADYVETLITRRGYQIPSREMIVDAIKEAADRREQVPA